MCAVAKTKHMGSILRQQTGKLWTSFNTTANTRKAVSMKYRGVFEQISRNDKLGYINYGSSFRWTCEKAVKKWLKWEKLANDNSQQK